MHQAKTPPSGRARSIAALVLLGATLAAPARGAEAAPASLDPSLAGTTRAPDGVRRVTYIPEIVKAQLKEEIRRELVEQMKQEGGGAPGAIPEWLRRFHFRGDARYRAERILFTRDNVPVLDFNAINTGSPINTSPNSFVDFTNERWLDVDRNRTRARVRARLGFDADVVDGLVAAVRVATGDSASPVSTNQTLGASGGNFSKYQLLLDRAALRLDRSRSDGRGVVAQVGRFENPFVSTDLVWDEDVSFDGLAVKGTAVVGKGRIFLTAGAFPLFATPLDLSPQNQEKFRSHDRWLYAAQAGIDWRPVERVSFKVAAALHDFYGAQGRASSPCDTDVKGVDCDTDAMRPSFAQKGNTYFPLRTPSPGALYQETLNPTGTPRYEYFGLASKFQVLEGTLRLDAPVGALRLGLDVDAAWNVAFRRGAVAAVAVNNFGSCNGTVCDRFVGGDKGVLGRIAVGSATLSRRWDWNLAFTYRYVESDATLDAFVDSDFGLGGTNLKGFGVVGSAAVADNVIASVRWMSADVVAGSPYSVDVLQLDLSARY